ARRTIIDWRRAHRSTEDLAHAVHIGTVDDHADPHQSLLFKKALEQLSQDQQDILRLRFWHDLSFQEIATIMHKRPESCRMQASRAIKSLRGLLPAELFLSFLFLLYG